MHYGFRSLVMTVLSLTVYVATVWAQSGGSGSIQGVVKDPSGGTVGKATVEISNAVSG